MKDTVFITTKLQKETRELASKVARALTGGEILILEGELGGGKTTFVQGLAKALGVKKAVTSPSFILKQRFSTDKNFDLVHIDLYRLDKKLDPELFEELGDPNTVAVIEWGNKIKKYLKDYLQISFVHQKNKDWRKITIQAEDKKLKKLIQKINR